MRINRCGWTLLIVANALMWGVLSLYRPGVAAPQAGRQPFSNSVEQRGQMIRQLQEIKILLKQQNELLRAQSAKPPAHARNQR